MSLQLEELCLEITGKCLMNCIYCSSSCVFDDDHIISLIKIKELLKDAKSLNTKIIEISGGEPLLHPGIIEIIEEAKKNFEVRLYTSGFVGKERLGISKEVLMQIANLCLDRIIFNLEGSTANTHEKITRTMGSFDSVINSVEIAKSLGLWVGVHFVPMKPNYEEFFAVANLCKELQVDELAVLRFVSQGRGKIYKYLLELSKDEFKELLRKIIQSKKAHENLLQIRTGCPMNFCSIMDESITPVHCKAGLSTLLISFDGKTVPCPALKQSRRFDLGNIYHDSLINIWENNNILNHLRNIDYTSIKGCDSCRYLDYCQGRCMAQRFYEHGDIQQGPDPLCPSVNEEIQKKELEVYAGHDGFIKRRDQALHKM